MPNSTWVSVYQGTLKWGYKCVYHKISKASQGSVVFGLMVYLYTIMYVHNTKENQTSSRLLGSLLVKIYLFIFSMNCSHINNEP